MVWHITYKDLSIKGDDKVYKPDEDSILLASNIENVFIQSNEFAVDFGSGSGIISMVLGLKDIYVVSIDIDHSSCRHTLQNIRDNDLDGYIDVVCTSYYLDVFRRDLSITVFSNPPYLPVDYKDLESRAWAGGRGGLDIIKELFISLNNFLCFHIYLVMSSYTDISQFKNMMQNFSFNFEKVDSLSFPGETIYLYHVWRGCK